MFSNTAPKPSLVDDNPDIDPEDQYSHFRRRRYFR